MKEILVVLFGAFGLCSQICYAQQTPSPVPDAPVPQSNRQVSPIYSPPSQGERFKSYIKQTYGPMSIIEAGLHGGIQQARDSPSQWPQGGQGYADRFGSAMGEIAVRGTTEYLIADLFREDLRRVRCNYPCSESKFKLAFENAYLARKGDDGHESFSVARLVGPFSGSAVAVNTWYPADSKGSNIAKEAGLHFGLIYVRQLIRESISR
jgi:hypothetical protein